MEAMLKAIGLYDKFDVSTQGFQCVWAFCHCCLFVCGCAASMACNAT